jgi:hypothetical protein
VFAEGVGRRGGSLGGSFFLASNGAKSVCVAYVISGLVRHHDPVIEGVELEIAILPPLLLPLDISGKEASEFVHGRRL